MIIFSEFRVYRFVSLICLFMIFSAIYLILCDDPTDFGGISVLHDSMRQYVGQDIAESQLKRTPALTAPVTGGTLRREMFGMHDVHAETTQKTKQVTRNIKKTLHKQVRSEKIYKKYTWTRWLNMLYFSMSNTITMGYGDVYPISTKSKLLVITQIMCIFGILCIKS